MKQKLKQWALDGGAAAVGVAAVDRLGDLPSMDPSYLLPGARSVVSLMLPFDDAIVRRYLEKEDRDGLQSHETELYRTLYRIGERVAAFLRSEGFQAVVAEPNLDYRCKVTSAYRRTPYPVKQAVADWFAGRSGPLGTAVKRRLARPMYERDMAAVDWNLTPSFSHRYGAVAAGIGRLGWSGNVLHPDHGARVLYNTVVTDARMASDPMMEETPCDGCRYCVRVCQSGMIHGKEEDRVTIGGRTFAHNRKAHNLRCILVCAGFVGQWRSPGWSTWSPGRLDLPDTDEGIEGFWNAFARDNLWRHNYHAKVLSDLVYHSERGFLRKDRERFQTTCGFCQYVCARGRKARRRNYDRIVESGEVVEGPGFSFRVAGRGTHG